MDTPIQKVPTWPLSSIIRAIVRAHKSRDKETDETRVNKALNALLALTPKEGRSSLDDEHLLEMIAFEYSLLSAGEISHAQSLTTIIREIIRFHPSTSRQSIAVRDSITRRLLRKFKQNQDELLLRHAFDASRDHAAAFQSLQTIFAELRKLKVPLDDSFLPSIYRNKV